MPWLDLIRAVTGAGVQVRRARIVCESASDYARFSHAGTQPNIDAGRPALVVTGTTTAPAG